MIKSFRVTDVQYHRNGICGRSFHSVRFSFESEGTFYPNMIATMPYNAIVNADLRSDGVECFVVNMNDPSDCMRGDDFAKQVHEAILLHQRESRDEFDRQTSLLRRKSG
jgi:hypothetical protein